LVPPRSIPTAYFLSILIFSIDLYRHLWTHLRAYRTPCALVRVLRRGLEISFLVEPLLDHDHTERTRIDAIGTPLTQFFIDYNHTFHTSPSTSSFACLRETSVILPLSILAISCSLSPPESSFTSTETLFSFCFFSVLR